MKDSIKPLWKSGMSIAGITSMMFHLGYLIESTTTPQYEAMRKKVFTITQQLDSEFNNPNYRKQ